MYQGQLLFPLLGAPPKTKLHNCHADTEDLVQSNTSSIAVSPESMISQKFRSGISVVSHNYFDTFAHIIFSSIS